MLLPAKARIKRPSEHELIANARIMRYVSVASGLPLLGLEQRQSDDDPDLMVVYNPARLRHGVCVKAHRKAHAGSDPRLSIIATRDREERTEIERMTERYEILRR
jgi:hypothetical protein